MTYLVTGAAGFVGLAVTERLLTAGASVIGIDLIDLPETAKGYLKSLPGMLSFRRGDVRSAGLAEAVPADVESLKVIHCAAVTPNLRGEMEQPRAVLASNLDATAAVLDLAMLRGAERIVYVSSGGVYGNLKDRADLVGGLVDEVVTQPRPENLYAVSKFAGELAAKRYRVLFDLPIHIARVGLVFGPWERLTGARQLVSAPHQIVTLVLKDQSIVLERDSVRGWTNSRDIAAGIVGLADAGQLAHDIYNIATPHRWPLTLFIDHLRRRRPALKFELAGKRPANAWLRFNFDAPNHNITRLSEVIGPDAMMSAEKAIENYLDWVDRFWTPDFARLE